MPFLQTGLSTLVATLALLVGGACGLSWLNGITVQHIVNAKGKSSSDLWLMKPGLWLHEASHAVVGRLFGLRIAEFSLRASADQRTDGHVTFQYRRHSLWQRLGLFFAAGAPVWVSGGLALALAKRAFWPQVPLNEVRWATLQPDLRWALAWLAAVLLLSLGANLSGADVKMLLRGVPAVALLLVVVFALGWWLWPAGLVHWQALNSLLAWLVAALAAVAVLLRGLVQLWWR